MEAAAYLPMDRRQALARGQSLPERSTGAALFADISGFTPLAEALARELGASKGAEELTHHLNQVYDALIDTLHQFGGSVISFSGDAITCWFDGHQGLRASACALAMQATMEPFGEVRTSGGTPVSLGMKVAVVAGSVRRFVVGDPEHCLLEVMAGDTLDRLAAVEQLAERGEVILEGETIAALGDWVVIKTWRTHPGMGSRAGVLTGLTEPVPPAPWPPLAPDAFSMDQVCGWLLPPVQQRLESGQGEFLAELRPAAALFLQFGGIDYDADPAAMEKLDHFIRGVEGILNRYEGSLLNLSIGDKGSYTFACFGAPIAHEDDPARSAAVALELAAYAASLVYLTPVKIGLASGRMRTGAYGSHSRRTYSALGDAVNLAARLMAAAEPGQILVTQRVRNTAGRTFTWEDMPPVRVKGKAGAVPIARLVAKTEHTGMRLLEPHYTLPMVGRQAALEQIHQRVGLVLGGKGQIVGITAEAGMGKSRLAAEVIQWALGAGLVPYGGECQSYGTTTSYLVWRPVWQALFGLDAKATLDDQVAALTAHLGAIDPGLLPRLPLLGAVLNLPIPDNELTEKLDAKVRKSSLEALLVDCLRARALADPLLIVLEDCHWLDPLSHDLVEEIGRAIPELPVLLLLIYRPPDIQRLQAPRVSQFPHFTEIVLDAFTPEEAGRLIERKLAQFADQVVDVPQAFAAQITERAAGNPFYIEELLNYLRDRGIQAGDLAALSTLELPASLHSLVLSRMDQLTESQQITVKVASVIGRLFSAAMVWGAYPQLGSFKDVKENLQVLSDLEIAPLDTPEPELTYLFKHIITQEVAYESLLHATRAMLHEQIGLAIERTYPESLDQQVNLLAFHFARSENQAKKQQYLLRAGEAAQASYANETAIEYYQKVVPLLPEAERGAVLRKLGKVFELTGQWEAAAAGYQQALSLAVATGDLPGQAWCQTEIGELYRKQGQYDQAKTWLERARDGFEALGHRAGVGQVLHYGGMLADQQGDFEHARALWLESLAIRRDLDDQPAIGGLLSNLAIVAARQGDFDTARGLLADSLAVRRAVKDRWAVAVTLNNIGFLSLLGGRMDEARPALEEALALQREIGDRWMIGNALNNLGNVARDQSNFDEARAMYAESLGIYRVLGDKCALAYLLEDTGRLAAQQGAAGRALHLAGAAATLREAIGAPLTPSEVEQLDEGLAPARAALGDRAEAAWSAGQALSLEAAVSLALGA